MNTAEKVIFEVCERIQQMNIDAFKGRTDDMFGGRSKWLPVRTEGAIVICDCGGVIPAHADIVRICEQIRFESGVNNLTRAVVYRGKGGLCDGVEVDNCFNFIEFYPIGKMNMLQAVKECVKWNC